jgi:DNA-binding winged helix-turn-helix (wHTH) protein/tetratricopeptide (TPR) repeat protein/TolB-like protein
MCCRFADFELDRRRFELRRGGSLIKLEPKVFDVLARLIANRDRVVSARELLEAIWPDEFVTPSALSRCIAAARKAVGDDGSEQRIIKTVHGRGYRFVADVVEHAVEPETAPIPQTPQAPAPLRPARRTAALLAVAAVALIVVVFAVLRSSSLIGSQPNAAASTKPPERLVRLALLPISTPSTDPDLQLLGVSMTDLVRARIGAIPGLVVRAPDYSAQVSARSRSLVEFARTAGVSHVLSGHIDRRNKVRLSLSLHEITRDGDVRTAPVGEYDLPLLQQSGDLTTFIRVRDAIGERLAKVLLPAFNLPAAASRPRDTEAYRLYLLASSRFVQQVSCDSAALGIVKQSLEIDPVYAPAWLLLGWAHYNQVASCGEDGAHYQAALDAARRAAELEPGPGPLVLNAVVLIETGRVEEAYALLQSEGRAFPASAEIAYARSYALRYAGFLSLADEDLDRTLDIDPLYLSEAGWTPNTRLYLGQLDSFLLLLPGTEAPMFRVYRGLAELWRNQAAAAHEALGGAFQLNPDDLFARLGLALFAIAERRQADATKIIVELQRSRDKQGSRDGEFTFKLGEALAQSGNLDGSADPLDLAVEQGFFCPSCFVTDPLLAPIRSTARFQPILSKALKRHHAFAARFGLASQAGPELIIKQ